MNCKQGDLARVVGFVGGAAGLNDRIVRCERFYVVNNTDGWVLADPLVSKVIEPYHDFSGTNYYPGDIAKHGWVADYHLRPIGNPGDDAVDETLQWLPVPSLEKTS